MRPLRQRPRGVPPSPQGEAPRRRLRHPDGGRGRRLRALGIDPADYARHKATRLSAQGASPAPASPTAPKNLPPGVSDRHPQPLFPDRR